ncbi:ABC transporter permease [Marinicrinis lubricantis]|uniref:ABC transporter permease n=1 Tax=Marinicrinis lubricantis TaxID=2086470 RepID=A0ABW1IMS5_9BACL
MFVLVLYSFNDSRINAVWSGFTFDWYVSLLDNRQVMEAFMNSVTIAITTAIVSTVLGTMTALAFHRYSFRWQFAWSSLLYLPIILPDLLMGLSLLLMFSYFSIPLGKMTIMIAHIAFCIPFVFVIVSTRLQSMRNDLAEAAQDLGATPWQTFRHVTLPMLMPSIVAGALLSLTLSLDDFVISFFVSGPGSTTLPVYIYGMVKRGVTPEVNALATVMIVITLILVALAEIVRRNSNGTGNNTDESV